MTFSIDSYAWPAYMGRTPFDHQRHTTAFLIANRRAFVLNDMGTGKTLAALWACDILFTAQKIRRVLIIGPLSTMRSVWYNEIMLNMPHRTVCIAHGPKKKQIIGQQTHFVVMNHDGIKSMEDEILAQAFDLIIIDELTAYKASSDRTKCMKRIADRTKAVWGMTGEITPNSPVEAFHQAQIVNPSNKFLPRYYGQFRDACMLQVNEMIWVPRPEAPQVVAMCVQPAIRYTRDQCLDLPDTTYITLESQMSAEQKEWYSILKKKAIIDHERGTITAVNAGVMLNKLLQISAGAVKDVEGNVIEIGAEDRLNQLLEIFEQTPQKKLVVSATYRATIDMLMRELTKRKIKVDTINGDVPGNRRSTIIDRFQNGDLEVIILQPQSAAHGITLTAASTLVWFSLIPSNELFQQLCARIVRAGQTKKTSIYMFVSTPAEQRVATILKEEGDLSAEVNKLFEELVTEDL